MAKLHDSVKNSSIFVYVSVAKRAVQTVHSLEVNVFIEVLSHGLIFFDVLCAFCFHCAFFVGKI